MGGTIEGFGFGSQQRVFIAKLTTNGDLEWVKLIGLSTGVINFTGLEYSSSNDILVAGAVNGAG